MRPPVAAELPSQSVTRPPAPSTIGISGDDVVGLKPGLDDDVGVAGGDHAEGVAVAAVAGEAHRRPRPGRRPAGRRRRRSPGVVVNSAASARLGAGARRERRRGPPGAAVPGARAIAGKALAGEGLGHHAEQRLALAQKADQRAPHRQAGDEGAGAVDRIEHPDEFRVRRARCQIPRRRCRGPGKSR